MKVISIWQPFASLAIKGCKVFETRTWAAPASIIGKRIGIASTKGIKPVQRAYFEDEGFVGYYARTGLPSLDELPCGYLLGTVHIDSCEYMSPEFMEEVSDEEQAYGHWEIGNYAWRLVDPIELSHPIPIRGAQGIYDWHGVLTDGFQTEDSARQAAQVEQQGRPVLHQEGQLKDRRGLRLV